MEGICKELTDCALISKSAGGIGLSVHSVRAFGSRIKTVGFFEFLRDLKDRHFMAQFLLES